MRIVISAFLIAVSISSSSQRITFRDEGSKISFTIRNFGLNVEGTFKGLSGQFILNRDTIEKSYFKATVSSKTINTGVSLRDKHLRGENYFDSNKFAVIKIESNKITRSNGNWRAVATLTIKDMSETVNIPFTLEEYGRTYLFKGTFSINRRHFDIGGNSLTLSDIVEVRLEAIAHE